MSGRELIKLWKDVSDKEKHKTLGSLSEVFPLEICVRLCFVHLHCLPWLITEPVVFFETGINKFFDLTQLIFGDRRHLLLEDGLLECDELDGL